MDLEKALEKIIDLESQLKEMSETNASLKINNDSLQAEVSQNKEQIQSLKQMNMRYFERLTMETKTQPTLEQPSKLDNKPEEPLDWDSFLEEWD